MSLTGRGLTRRDLLRDAAAAGAAATLLGPADALAARRPRRAKPTVAVLGGGMAGLAAAHELIERGFDVHVYERKSLGGKARSIKVAQTAAAGHRPLPGEHGFRFFPGFYHHVPDSMRRIPEGGNANGVWDNLVATSETRLSRANGDDIIAPGGFEAQPNPSGIAETIGGGLNLGSRIPPNELAEFTNRILVFLTSCDERRFGQWEHVPWLEFVKAEGKSKEYNDILARGLTRTLVAAKEQVASARTICNMAEAFVYTGMNRGNDGEADRLLDGPTNEVWIDPWVRLLRSKGVKFHIGQTVTALHLNKRGRLTEATVKDRRNRRRAVEADWFVSAMPAERARRLWNKQVLARDPELTEMRELQVDWMNGIQYYLRRKVPVTRGHVAYMDAPWALTSISQAQFWAERDFAKRYGDGQVVDCLSVDVSDWDTPGIVYGRPAKRCTKNEIAIETWAQLKLHLNDREEILRDDDVHSFFLDPAIRYDPKRKANSNDEPLLVNTVGSWDKRPTARTRISNLFLAGDYVQTNIDLATMEGANESGRAAVRAILEASGSKAEPPAMYSLYRPPEFEAAKRADLERWRAGQPNALDTP